MSDLCHRDNLSSRLEALALFDTAAVLDIGAGGGCLFERLRQRGHNRLTLGLDLLPGPGQVSGHAEALPLLNAQFDAVLLRPQDVLELAESYDVAFPLPSHDLLDQLQLVVFSLKKGGPSFAE